MPEDKVNRVLVLEWTNSLVNQQVMRRLYLRTKSPKYSWQVTFMIWSMSNTSQIVLSPTLTQSKMMTWNLEAKPVLSLMHSFHSLLQLSGSNVRRLTGSFSALTLSLRHQSQEKLSSSSYIGNSSLSCTWLVSSGHLSNILGLGILTIRVVDALAQVATRRSSISNSNTNSMYKSATLVRVVTQQTNSWAWPIRHGMIARGAGTLPFFQSFSRLCSIRETKHLTTVHGLATTMPSSTPQKHSMKTATASKPLSNLQRM